MLNVATSYFAQIRNFKPNMIPISTAVSDPKWFHDYKGPTHKFIDKRGVINGIRCNNLSPGVTCSNLCHGHADCTYAPDSCEFLARYNEQLMFVPTEPFKEYCDKVASECSSLLRIDKCDLILVFMVYEKYDNPCSKRGAIIRYLRRCGYNAQELNYPIV